MTFVLEDQDLTNVNLPELRYQIDTITKDPTSWNQLSWQYTWQTKDMVPRAVALRCEHLGVEIPGCGSAYCLAGNVAIGQGAVFVFDGGDSVSVPTDVFDQWYPEGSVHDPNPDHTDVSRFAARVLGLTGSQEYWLFDGGRTLDDFERFYAAAAAQQ